MRSRSACGADMALACHQVRLSRGTWTKSPSDEVGAVRAGWHGETPLWYFVLREADVRCDGNRLGPVGARIVGEVLVAELGTTYGRCERPPLTGVCERRSRRRTILGRQWQRRRDRHDGQHRQHRADIRRATLRLQLRIILERSTARCSERRQRLHRPAATHGFIAKAPCYNSVFNCLEDPAMTPIIKGLITRSALPLRALETDFAVDSTGFGTQNFYRHYSAK